MVKSILFTAVCLFNMPDFTIGQTPYLAKASDIPRRPNIIIIMADDMGYGDLSAFGGNGSSHTPNIDALVAGGLKLTNFHSNGVVCSPTRASLMTGLYPQEAGIASVVTAKYHRHTGMSPDKCTLAEFLKEADYTTAIFGKWHLGYQPEFGPVAQGFDYFKGFVSGNIDYFSHIDQEGYPDWWRQKALHSENGYLTELITDHAIDFMEQIQKRKQHTPFLLYLAHGAPHYPLQGPDDSAYRTIQADFPIVGNRSDKENTYKEMIESLDENIGRIVAWLQDRNLLEQTLILFFSDNGATRNVGSNAPFRGAKSSVYEGGHHVPAVFYWQGVIDPGTTNNLVLTMDIFPTVADILDVDLTGKPRVSGTSVLPFLLEPNEKATEGRIAFWRWLANENMGSQKAVRQGPWKLVIHKEEAALYNLEKDVGETKDVKKDHPRKLRDLMRALDQWEASLNDDEITVRDVNQGPDRTEK